MVNQTNSNHKKVKNTLKKGSYWYFCIKGNTNQGLLSH